MLGEFAYCVYMNCSIYFKLPFAVFISSALKAISHYNHSLVYFHLEQAATRQTCEAQVQFYSKVYRTA